MRTRGICPPRSPDDPDFKRSCKAAYILAAELTGTSQLCALFFAPFMGWLSDRYEPQLPLLTSGVVGFASFAGFAALRSLSAGADRTWAFLLVAGMGIAQIGAIVSSLALIGQAVAETSAVSSLHHIEPTMLNPGHHILNNALAVNPMVPDQYRGRGRLAVKGSIAGVYSLCGAVGILLLTKLGGLGADKLSSGVPFDMLAIFFAIEVAFGCWLVFKGKTNSISI